MLEGIDERGEFRPGVRDGVMAELKHFFRPEFLSYRFKGHIIIVVFHCNDPKYL